MKRLGWCVVFAALGLAVAQAQEDFPFDGEMMLDAAPMRGSKRIPNIDIAANGAMTLEMWCNRIEGQVVVAADTITILTTGQPTNRECPPEQVQGDAELISALNEVTNWRRQGSTVLLIGPRTLRFRMLTN